jgi:formamidopyrimidine-DNA glycosylase
MRPFGRCRRRRAESMPELPEVETIRRDLEREVVGRRITEVAIRGPRTVRRGTKAGVVKALTGAKISGTKRRGKYLVLTLDEGHWLVVHLRMSGQLLRAAPGSPRPKHTHAVITFAEPPTGSRARAKPGGFELLFVDPRTFGELFIADPEDLTASAPELAELGVDALEGLSSWIDFGRLVLAKRARLKDLLTDQRVIAGLGNIYSDEVLHNAGLRYDRRSDTLNMAELRRLFRAVHEVLQAAVAARGSSLTDDQYVDLYGQPGTFTAQHQVYGRAGQACHRCRHIIEKARWQGRSTFYCPACQV